MNVSSADLAGVLPSLILAAGALVLLLSEVFLRGANGSGRAGAPTSAADAARAQLPAQARGATEAAPPPPDRRYQAWLSAAFAGVGLWAALAQAGDPAARIFAGAAVSDGFAHVVAAIVCGALVLSCLLAASYLEALNASRGEFYALALFSAAGMCLLAQANDLIVIFISLEVMSLAIYCLTAYLRRGVRPAEAAFKYFVLGSFASAVFLYGAALAFGATGSTGLSEVSQAVLQVARGQSVPGSAGLLTAAAAMLVAGFAFKVAAVPFHMWVPDVYEGAPAPVTGFMAAGVKAAAFAVLVRILVVGFGDGAVATGPRGWAQLVAWLALLTMLVGNVLAVPQRSVKRMLAYSSIAHAGYLLVAVAAMGATGSVRAGAVQALSFYLASYAATVVGAFGVVALIERKLALTGKGDDLTDWGGLAEKHPGLSAAMSLFMVSLAGIPPTAGFMAKLEVFRSAVDAGLIPLAVAGVLTSAAGLYYYLRVVVYVYMHPQTRPDAVAAGRLFPAGLALLGCALLVIWLGISPGSFAQAAQTALTGFAAR